MNIGHIGASTNPNAVNGVNYVVWSLATAQAKLGHKVFIVVTGQPSHQDVCFAKNKGISFIVLDGYFSFFSWLYGFRKFPKLDVLHFHSVFLPKHFLISLLIKKPRFFVITPHGLSWFLLKKNKLRKIIYTRIIERYHFGRAGAILSLNNEETKVLLHSFGVKDKLIYPVFNPVEENGYIADRVVGDGLVNVVYFGRLDPYIKGIDLLFDLALKLPSVNFSIYSNDKESALIGLTVPNNVRLHSAVFDEEKYKILSRASLYIQTSRHEGFPISILEAMKAKVPVVITDAMQISSVFREKDIGLVIPFNGQKASVLLSDYLRSPHLSKKHIENAKNFVDTECSPEAVAKFHLGIYDKVISS